MTTPAKDGAGTCNGEPGKAGVVLLPTPKTFEDKLAFLRGGPMKIFAEGVLVLCPGCSACHPGDCIVCLNNKEAYEEATQGEHVAAAPDMLGSRHAYQRPTP